MKSYNDLAKEADAARKAGIELEGLTPIRAHIAKEVRAVFSLRLSPSELSLVSTAAKARGQKVGDFVRLAALAAARGEISVDSIEQTIALDELRDKVLDLVDTVERASGHLAARSQPGPFTIQRRARSSRN
jgi:uncharacterized protein (DUF1778 family)